MLAQHFVGYTHREAQFELATGIDDALTKPGTTLLAEAPCGSGKSVAYLVPAIWHAVHQGRRAVVVTANIALQEQLVRKDLPALQAVLPWPFTFALAKGIGNYICLRNYHAASGDASMFGLGDPDSDWQWRTVVKWEGSTAGGDLSDLPFELNPKVKLKVTTSSEDCIGRKCQHHSVCGAMRARASWQTANVVITNYHLYFADLAIRSQTTASGDSPAGILPDHEVVVGDEFHNAADIARDFLGFRVTLGQVKWAVRMLAPRGKDAFIIDRELQTNVHAVAERFFERLAVLERSNHYSVRLRKTDQFDAAPLIQVLADAGAALLRAVEVLPMLPDKAEDAKRGAERCRKIAASVRRAAALTDIGTWVYYIDVGSSSLALVGKPIDVAPLLRATLFDGRKTIIGTSATLTVNGSFDHVATDLGADVVDELAVDSPFDWSRRALLVVPPGLPPPNDPGFPSAAEDALVRIVEAARGRTLVLCTSYKMLGHFRDALRRSRACSPYAIIVQGEAPRTELLRQFKADTSSVLIGTDSFWEGVDVPGESLSCVVIDRLPFENAADPVLDAVTARTKAWFQKWMIPRAVIAFRQGVGRLLRTAEDRGVVVVLDTRIVDKGYGKMFLKSLPKMRLTRDVSEIGRFLE